MIDEQLFRKPAQGRAEPASMAAPAAQLGALSMKLKLAESRYANLQRRNRVTEESLLAFERDTAAQIRVLTQQVVELRRHVQELTMRIDAMQGELASVVPKHEFRAVERYLDLWQPMQFVTRTEASRLVEGRKHG